MAKARSVTYKILYDGQEVGLSQKTKSLSYTDNASGTADEITLGFEDRDALWLRDSFIPEKGHDLDVTIYFINWTRDGDYLPYHCGNFTVDDLDYSSNPRTFTIRGVSTPADEAFQTVPYSKTWQNVTLRQIAEEIKGKYGMSTVHYNATEPVIEKTEQDEKTDSAFLAEACDDQGLFIKIYKKAIVIFDKMIYEKNGAIAKFTETDFEEFSWNSTLNGTYTGATISYTNPNKKEKPIEITVGQGPRLLRINQKAENEAEAQRIAKAKVNLENEKAMTISFTAMGNPNIVATCNIEISGMGRCDGKYAISKVSHSLSSSGHKMRVTAYRIFDRL